MRKFICRDKYIYHNSRFCSVLSVESNGYNRGIMRGKCSHWYYWFIALCLSATAHNCCLLSWLMISSGSSVMKSSCGTLTSHPKPSDPIVPLGNGGGCILFQCCLSIDALFWVTSELLLIVQEKINRNIHMCTIIVVIIVSGSTYVPAGNRNNAHRGIWGLPPLLHCTIIPLQFLLTLCQCITC